MASNPFALFGERFSRNRLPSIDFERIRRDNPIERIVGGAIPLRRRAGKLIGNCPFHEDRTPSFTVYPDSYHCFGCGAHGDVVDFVMRTQKVGYGDALSMLRSDDIPKADIRPSQACTREETDKRSREAVDVWNSAHPINGTPAEIYLRGRGITIALPECLRFASLPWCRREHPALVALISGADGSPQAVHRIFLKGDGSKADLPDGKVKFSKGPLPGGAVHMSLSSSEMTVCAGIEEGLSLIQMFGMSVWAVPGDQNISGIEFPDSVRRVIVAHDNDASGCAAADVAVLRIAKQGREVSRLKPKGDYKDFCDELRGRVP